MYVLSVAVVGQWRGAWYLCDHFLDLGWKSNAVSLAVVIFFLVLCRATSNTLFAPLTNFCDRRNDVFECQPRFRSVVRFSQHLSISQIFFLVILLLFLQWESDRWNYIVDHLFTQFFIASLVALAWRSLWNIFNDVILPDDDLMSNLVSWLSGLAAAIFLLAIESFTSKVSRRLQKTHEGIR